MSRINIVRDACRRFQHLPIRTIARHLIATHQDLFENNLETARKAVRRVMGKDGKKSRKKMDHKELYRDKGAKILMPKTWRKNTPPYKLDAGLWGIISDVHVPFHEPKPLETTIAYFKTQKIDGILLNGDIFDCAAVSYWPAARRDFNRELELIIDFLDFLRTEFPDLKIVYKPGNHEYRLPRYFMAKAPELAETPLAQMETGLGLERRKIEFLDYFQLVYAGKLPILHGHEIRGCSTAVNPARGLFLKAKSFAACAHWHSTSEHTPKNIHDEYLTTWSFGCLCDLHPDYAPHGNNWNWGCALVNVNKDGTFEVENRRILLNGKLV